MLWYFTEIVVMVSFKWLIMHNNKKMFLILRAEHNASGPSVPALLYLYLLIVCNTLNLLS